MIMYFHNLFYGWEVVTWHDFDDDICNLGWDCNTSIMMIPPETWECD